MTVADALPWLNLLMLPMAGHILRTSERLARLEAKIELLVNKSGSES